MSKMKFFYPVIFVLFYLFMTVTISAQEIIWKCTTPEKSWFNCKKPDFSQTDKDTISEYITIDSKIRYQKIDGWGGCFNERGWDAMSVLSEKQRTNVIKAFFDPVEGCKLNYGRTPIGCSDYSTDWYSYNETPGDFEMKNFSIDRDNKKQIPFIKEALSFRPDLKLWGVPWSSPTWMKDKKDIFLTDPNIQEAYALYFSKYITYYKREGVNIFMVMPENEEPNIQAAGNPVNPFWTHFNNDMAFDFLRNYLIPRLKKDQPACEIWLGTLHMNQFDFVEKCFNDPIVKSYVKGIGGQWGGDVVFRQMKNNYPTLQLMQTETKCNIDIEPLRSVNTNDWTYAIDQWGLIKKYLESGANSFMLWNMILDETGRSITNWAQCSPVTIDSRSSKITYNPQFYAFKHFSYFVEPGSIRLKSTGNFTDQIAFVKTNGDLVLVVQNSHSIDHSVKIKFDGKMIQPVLPPRSWNTFILKTSGSN